MLVKDFSLNNQLVETRLLIKYADGNWFGYSYQWNAAQTDATQVAPAGADVQVGGQLWHFPSQKECLFCHNPTAGSSLDIQTPLLNTNFEYPATPSPPFTGQTANEIYTLNAVRLLNPAVAGAPASLPSYPDPLGTSGTVAERARSYLHANCSYCHQPGGPTPAQMDLRWQTTANMANSNTCGVTPRLGNLGIAGAKIIDPANPANSVLYLRMNRRDSTQIPSYQMPPVATNVVDDAAVQLISEWISQMSATCQ